MSDDMRYIGVGGVSLHVNRNANIWSELTMHLSRHLRTISSNYSTSVPIQIVVVYITPGFKNPVEFSGTRITVKSRKGPKRTQVEVAVPEMPFPEHDPEEAKKIILDLMLDSVKEVEKYGQKNKIIDRELTGARAVIKELWKDWNVSDFTYKIPEGLPYFDMPKVNECITRVYIEKLPDGEERRYNILLDQHGKEII